MVLHVILIFVGVSISFSMGLLDNMPEIVTYSKVDYSKSYIVCNENNKIYYFDKTGLDISENYLDVSSFIKAKNICGKGSDSFETYISRYDEKIGSWLDAVLYTLLGLLITFSISYLLKSTFNFIVFNEKFKLPFKK